MKKGSITQLFTVLCFAVAVGLQFAVSTVLSSMYSGGQLTEKGYVYGAYLVPQLCYIISIGVFSAVQRVPLGRVFRTENIKPIPYLYMILIALGLFFVALLPNIYLQNAIRSSGSNSSVLLPPMETAGENVLAVLLICLLPAIGEEMMFRKTFCDGMEGNNEWVIVLLGGLFFSLSHYNLVQTVHQFVLGCVLCFLYVRTRNISLTMIAHFMNNLLALYIARWTESFLDWNDTVTLVVAFFAGLIMLATGTILTYLKTKKIKGDGKVEPYTIGLVAFVGVVWLVSVVTSFVS